MRYVEVRDGNQWYVWGEFEFYKKRAVFLKEHRIKYNIHPPDIITGIGFEIAQKSMKIRTQENLKNKKGE